MSVFVGATGQKIILECGVDITAATIKQVKYQKPDGTSSNWAAAQESSTSISYTTTAITDLNIRGNWKFQAYVVTPSWSKHGEIDRLEIKETL